MEVYPIFERHAFSRSDNLYFDLKNRIQTDPTVREMTQSEIEEFLLEKGRDLMRALHQDHLGLLASQERERGLTGPVIGNDDIERTYRRDGDRELVSIFGSVRVKRMSYRGPRVGQLHPLDAALNLPADSYSFGIRRRVAVEASKNSFDETISAVKESTGVEVPKRQVEELARKASCDFSPFYEKRMNHSDGQETGPILVMSMDGKGVVMRREDLRDKTRQAAMSRTKKLRTRLCRGEKKNSKRMAAVAAVYTIKRFIRTPEEIVRELKSLEDIQGKSKRPKPEQKRVWATLEKEPGVVVEEMFKEAESRDLEKGKKWLALVDGNPSQIRLLRKKAKEAGVELVLILDIIHVLEYLWRAVVAFFKEGTKEAEMWVQDRFLRILKGEAGLVAAGIRRSATKRNLSEEQRKPVDICARYLHKYARFMAYNKYLANGYPIATGVIEGACRHLIKDRMDVTGARWSLKGAEAILKLRSLRSSGDFEEYWKYHQEQEFQRNHQSRYSGSPPVLNPRQSKRSHLRVVQ